MYLTKFGEVFCDVYFLVCLAHFLIWGKLLLRSTAALVPLITEKWPTVLAERLYLWYMLSPYLELVRDAEEICL